MPAVQLAHLNVAALRAALDSPAMSEFVAQLEPINALADASPGFIWRWDEERDPAPPPNPFAPDLLVNLSLWQDLASLKAYVYGSAHGEVMRRRRQWFTPLTSASMVLWWVPAGHRPTLIEAAWRLQRLRRDGAGAQAFTFHEPAPAPMTMPQPPMTPEPAP